MISNCGHDERGKYIGGKPGDQTGTEWHLINWYNRPWTCVLRYPEKAVRALISKLAIEAAKNNKVGYSQGNPRYTFWQRLQQANYSPNNIKVACSADCSSGVCAIVKAVGYIKGIQKLKEIPITTTYEMRSYFEKAGFKVLTAEKYLTSDNYLLPGDILLNDNHHTAINVTTGKNAVDTDSKPKHKYTGELPKIKANTSLKRGSKGKDVKLLQLFLNWYGNYKLDVDGHFGPLTEAAVKKYQNAEGLQVDGHFGVKSLARAKEVLR